ncbi:methyl-accepting chemotaxis protein [Rheinheimera aquimaris]|uniref:methyl-accepting chemotaxis protein n=2 Tax=Rheinheimera TaxID=67575 RepID=UPI001066184D|nr:methyl-accepting chemotaxis protein [Rheinheimera aquimaris]
MKHLIRNLSLRRKLMLLLLLPAIAAVLLAMDLLYLNWQQVRTAQYVTQAIDTSVSMNKLVATLQAERGASGVYLASAGARFTERLRQLRMQTDLRLQAFMALQQPELVVLQQQLQQLAELRHQIDQLTLSNSISAERYTALITAMIAQNHQLEAGLMHRDMAQQLATLNQFIEMKERAGRERAILGLVFSRGSFNTELLTRFTNNLGAYNAFSENFVRMLSPQQQHAWQQVTQHSSFAEVSRIQQLGFTTAQGGPLNVDDGQWFDIATERLTQMSVFEAALNADIAVAAGQLYQQSNRQLWLLLGVMVLLVTVLAFIATVTIRSIADAVSSVENTIAVLAGRDLSVRCHYQGQDEFGSIANSTNNMAQQLQRVIDEIGCATTQVAAAAEQSSAVTLQTSQGVQQQQQDTEMVATAMHEMSATVRDVAASTSQAAQLSDSVQTAAIQGQNRLQQTVALIQRLSGQVESTANVIDKVKHDSDAITSVLDVIRGIAEQTNLLALNAAIEAARAGEQGRGFAVVADEVRTLAQRTAQSTGDIQRMIEGLQRGAQQASDAMVISLEQAQEGREKVTQTGDILAQVLQDIKSINDKNIQIASAAEQQAAVADDINQKILSISDVAAQTSAGAEQTASTSTELARLAGQLQQMVARFKLA